MKKSLTLSNSHFLSVKRKRNQAQDENARLLPNSNSFEVAHFTVKHVEGAHNAGKFSQGGLQSCKKIVLWWA